MKVEREQDAAASETPAIYVSDTCRIIPSGDGGYIVWTRVHVHAGWQAAPIPKAAVSAILTREIERELEANHG